MPLRLKSSSPTITRIREFGTRLGVAVALEVPPMRCSPSFRLSAIPALAKSPGNDRATIFAGTLDRIAAYVPLSTGVVRDVGSRSAG